MDAKRFIVGTIVGGIVLFVVGYFLFFYAFASFYAANAGSATGADRSDMVWWAMVLANFVYAALIMYVFGNRSLSIGQGTMVAAIVGFLFWFAADFFIYSMMNVQNLTRTIVDPLLEIVHAGVAGAVMAAVLKKMPASSGPA